MALLIRDDRKRWRGNLIPYRVEPSLLSNADAAIALRVAINEWNQNTPIQLEELRADEEDPESWVEFRLSLSHCLTDIGRQGGRQVVGCALTATGFNAGSIMHEIGHAVGLYHEHQRPDRNDHISVLSDGHNYEIADEERAAIFGPYDCNSIMHYAATAGGIATISGGCAAHTADSPAGEGIGQRDQLSPGDILASEGWYAYDITDQPANRFRLLVDDVGTTHMIESHFRHQHRHRSLNSDGTWQTIGELPESMAFDHVGFAQARDGTFHYLGSRANVGIVYWWFDGGSWRGPLNALDSQHFFRGDVLLNLDGHLNCVACDDTGNMFHLWRDIDTPPAGDWHLQDTGLQDSHSPAIVLNAADGLIQGVAYSRENDMLFQFVRRANGNWEKTLQFAEDCGSPRIVQDDANLLHVFARSTDAIQHWIRTGDKWHRAPNVVTAEGSDWVEHGIGATRNQTHFRVAFKIKGSNRQYYSERRFA